MKLHIECTKNYAQKCFRAENWNEGKKTRSKITAAVLLPLKLKDRI